MVRVHRNAVTIDTDKEGYIRGLLFVYFQLLDESREHSRLLCLLLYALGFAFISIPCSRNSRRYSAYSSPP